MNPIMRSVAVAGVALAIGSATASDAAATTLAALTGDNTLILINIEQRQVVRRVNVGGLSGRLAGIDVRPADGQLYGVVRDGKIVTINTSNGASTAAGQLTLPLPAGQVAIDVNPVADAIRIVGANGKNLRHPFATSATVGDTDINFGVPPTNPFGDTTPRVLGVAYTNSVAGAKATQLLDIDTSPAALYLQFPPNSGTLVALGQINVRLSASLGFDISVDARGRNRAWVVTSNRLLEIDPIGGAVIGNNRVTGLNDTVRDVAVLP